MGTMSLDNKAKTVADVNGDGEVDTSDLLLLRRALVGLEEIPGSSNEFTCSIS